MKWTFALTLGLLGGLAAFAARPAAAQEGRLTLDRIFSGEFRNERFGPAKWMEDGRSYTTVEPSAALRGGDDIVRYDAATGARTVLVSAVQLVPEGSDRPLEIEDYQWSADGKRVMVYTNSQRVWRRNTRGDYWVLDLETGDLRKLGGPGAKPATLMFAKFSPDGTRAGYVREHDVYVEDLDDGTITPITTDGSETLINGTFDWVYEEELGDRDGWRWSPDGKRIAYWQLDASGVRDFLLIDDTDSLYSFTIPVQYPKAGTTNSAARIGIAPAGGGETTWVDIPGDPRNNYLSRLDWAASPDEVVVQQLDRLQHTLKVYLADASTGAARVIHVDRDSAWVDANTDLTWLDGGKEFLWPSDSSGWRHLYVISRDGKRVRDVTKGDFDAVRLEGVDEAGGRVYFLASPGDPKSRYLYRSRLDGSGVAERVTPADEPGTHSYDVGPGAAWAFDVHSRFGVPPRTDLVSLPDHDVVRILAANETYRDEVAALDRGSMEFFRVDADGVPIDGWIMKPPDFDPSKTYPILFHVYGEPAGQRVVDSWGGRDYLWHVMLTQQGYLVASVDPRGTPAPRGREWRKIIYQRIGTLTSRDIAAAARKVVAWPYVDADRVGIWGWSGGGSQTLNAMFRYPDVFDVGMAVAPVPDVRLYDTIYQERYLGLPEESPEVYEKSSPITWADGLKGDLLVVHGTGDDNVHWQGTERLINALVKADKPFSMMAYPNRTHCICEGENTQRHLFGLLTRYLEEHLPAGGR